MEEMTGLSISAFADEATNVLLAGRHRRRYQGMSEHYQTAFRSKDGSVVQVLVSATPFMDRNVQVTGALAMVTDVTATREAEDIVRSQSLRMRAQGNQDSPGGMHALTRRTPLAGALSSPLVAATRRSLIPAPEDRALMSTVSARHRDRFRDVVQNAQFV